MISIGHGVGEVADAIAEQARAVAYVQSTQFRPAVGEELADRIARFAPGALNHVCFYSGGSEAIEAAVKLARQFHLLQGQGSRHVVLSRRRSYHGATLFALGVGGVPARQAPYTPYLITTPKQVECYPYRCPFGEGHPCCDLACADDQCPLATEQVADHLSPATSRSRSLRRPVGTDAPPGYYERIREICRAHEILFISDEVVTGWGRTGKKFGISTGMRSRT